VHNCPRLAVAQERRGINRFYLITDDSIIQKNSRLPSGIYGCQPPLGSRYFSGYGSLNLNCLETNLRLWGNMMEPRLFTMIRKNDESHVSGTGRVLDGVVFHNGKVVICWPSEEKRGYPSLGIFDSFEAFKFIHIDSHPANETEIVWL
jgi:hypothetical protein